MATAETKPAVKPQQLPAIAGPRLPYHPLIEERFGIDKASWKALVEAIFPNATSVESVILALSYCKARKLDPFKRNVHIVPIWNKQTGGMIDTVWPGIGELRTTAFRTGDYAGRGDTTFGEDVTQKVGSKEITYPEWAQVTVHRMVKGQRVPFAGPRVYWVETYATYKRGDDTPNEMWETRPRGQLEKCAEAAALRAAFPEEIGGDYIPEEVQHQRGGPVVDEQPPVRKLEDLTQRLAAENENGDTAETPHETEREPGDESEQSESKEPVEHEFDEAAFFGNLDRDLAEATAILAIGGILNRYTELAPDDETKMKIQERADNRRDVIRATRGDKTAKAEKASA